MTENRRIRIFLSSTFRDMSEERNQLMVKTWPELRRFCRERQVELVEVDLRWGVTEEQSARKETLKLCLDEISACRPFFIGLLGERYGWISGEDAFTTDLIEEHPWLHTHLGKSLTELEILHGVLNSPETAGRSFFYFRSPVYAQGRGADFFSDTQQNAENQRDLKERIRQTCAVNRIPLQETYRDPRALADLVLTDMKDAVEAHFPAEDAPEPLTREARNHEALAKLRRITYVGRSDYFAQLDRHAASDGGPMVLLGESGIGKSAFIANWIAHWRISHPDDFIFLHFIGVTPDSTDYQQLMRRLIAEIKRWTGDPDEPPLDHECRLRDFPVWLSKARIRAEHLGVRCIVIFDALNQLNDDHHARLLGWLPTHIFDGVLRLIVSTLPGESQETIAKYGWHSLTIEPLTVAERRVMSEHYLARFGKRLDGSQVDRLVAASATSNPLYLKSLLDELRITGTHSGLNERLDDYLAATDVLQLLKKVLARYQRDYEFDRPGLVSDALGLIWAARRGLTESELLHLLRSEELEQLPLVAWSPLRAALDESLIDSGGILSFGHDFLRLAVEAAFVQTEARCIAFRLRLANEFEHQPISARTCDELPWLFFQTKQHDRLRASLLNVDRFLEIKSRDEEELRRYWIDFGQERTLGLLYHSSFEKWSSQDGLEHSRVMFAASELAHFLSGAAIYDEAEWLMRYVLSLEEKIYEDENPSAAITLNGLAHLLQETNRLDEAEPLLRRVVQIFEANNPESQTHYSKALDNLAQLLQATSRLEEAELLMRRAVAIAEQRSGLEHPAVAIPLHNLSRLLQDTGRLDEAEPLTRRAVAINEINYGAQHPNTAIALNNLAWLLFAKNQLAEAEPLMRRALAIDERSYGTQHPHVAVRLNNLAQLLQAKQRPDEAEPLLRRGLAIEIGARGPEHPFVGIQLNNLARLLRDTNQLSDAESIQRRSVEIFLNFALTTGHSHLWMGTIIENYVEILKRTGRTQEQILTHLDAMAPGTFNWHALINS